MNATPVFIETPNVAAPNMPLGSGGLKSVKIKPVSAEFKHLLKCCLENEYAAVLQALFGVCSTSDNSIVINSTVQKAGIAGILEGFGLLDYQTDTLLPTEHNVQPALPKAAQEQTVAADMANLLLEWMQAEKKPMESGMSEQFARMLSNNKFNTLPSDLQQQVLSKVKEYLGSLESTNNEMAANKAAESITPPDTDGTVDFIKLLLQPKMQKPAQKAEIPLPADNTEQKVLAFENAVSETSKMADKAAVNKDYPAAAQNAAEEPDMPQVQVKVSGMSGTVHKSENADSKETALNTADMQASAAGTETAVNEVPKAQAPATAAETKAEPETKQPDFVRDNVVRIVDKINTHFESGRHEFDVELKPEFLGKLSIKLTMENGNIRMTIKAGDSAVKGMMCEQAPALQNLLRDKGITVTSIDISYQGEASMDGGYQAYRQNGRQSNADKGGRRQISDWLSLYDGAADTADYYYLRGSSVEYLA